MFELVDDSPIEPSRKPRKLYWYCAMFGCLRFKRFRNGAMVEDTDPQRWRWRCMRKGCRAEHPMGEGGLVAPHRRLAPGVER